MYNHHRKIRIRSFPQDRYLKVKLFNERIRVFLGLILIKGYSSLKNNSANWGHLWRMEYRSLFLPSLPFSNYWMNVYVYVIS